MHPLLLYETVIPKVTEFVPYHLNPDTRCTF